MFWARELHDGRQAIQTPGNGENLGALRFENGPDVNPMLLHHDKQAAPLDWPANHR